MTITIFGAGAIGGTTGAAPAQAGHDVLLVDNHAPHVEAIKWAKLIWANLDPLAALAGGARA
jgi:ketopantoate reductase